MAEELDASAMAFMMGFSSFGDQDRPNKKRRFNPGADAAVHTTTQIPEASTGSNAAPLGERKVAQSANANEIDLEEDDEDVSKHPTGDTPNLASPSPSLPQRPAVAAPGGSRPARGGARSDRWYEGYYDDLSNANPWERLEQNLGLQPRGKWMLRPEWSMVEANRT